MVIIASVSVLPILSIYGLSVADQNIILEPIEHGSAWWLLCTLSVSVATTQIMRSKVYKLVQTNSQIAGEALIVTAAVMSSFAAQLCKLIGIAGAG